MGSEFQISLHRPDILVNATWLDKSKVGINLRVLVQSRNSSQVRPS
jgi:hypothetical protein